MPCLKRWAWSEKMPSALILAGKTGAYCQTIIQTVPGSPVFSGFLVIFFDEAVNKFFKDCPHAVIIKPRQTNYGFFLVFVDGIRAEVDCAGLL